MHSFRFAEQKILLCLQCYCKVFAMPEGYDLNVEPGLKSGREEGSIPMRKIVRCACGMEIRSEHDPELIRLVQTHAMEAHELVLSDDQVRDMMEIEQ